jgi:hypothetical protein
MRRPERRRLALGTGTFLAAIIILFHHLSEWAYWTPIAVLLLAGLVCAYPGRAVFIGSSAPPIASTVDVASTDAVAPSDASIEPGLRSR